MQSLGFPREVRLLKPEEFSFVFKEAHFKGHHKSSLLLARSNGLNTPRLGFVISKRNVRLACNRNRIKRVIREQFRMQKHQLPPIDIVTLARPSLAAMENDQIRQIISRLFSELYRQYAKYTASKEV